MLKSRETFVVSCNEFVKTQESITPHILQHRSCLPQLPAYTLGILPSPIHTILLQNVTLKMKSLVTECFNKGEGSGNRSDGCLLERLGVHARYVFSYACAANDLEISFVYTIYLASEFTESVWYSGSGECSVFDSSTSTD
jgi:hypothetical protein